MYDLNSYFIIRQLFQRRYDSTDRALYVALDDQVQFLDFAFLDLAEQFFQRRAGVSCQNFFSQFILSFFCDLSCDLLILHGIEHVTCVWNIGQTEDLHSSCRTCLTDFFSLIIGHESDLAGTRSCYDAHACL